MMVHIIDKLDFTFPLFSYFDFFIMIEIENC